MARLFFVACVLLSSSAQAVTFDWAFVGNPGNPDDDTGFGGVGYNYRISKHEVTNAQYTEFLNAADPTGGNQLRLYNSNMSNSPLGGIVLNATANDGSKYEVKPGRGNNPVIFVSFGDALRFVNWLGNGKGDADTSFGAYDIVRSINKITRNLGAKYFIPSEDEWYKAAYYDPILGIYYDYPTGTDTEPYSDSPSNLNTPDNTNVANFRKDDGVANGYNEGFAVTESNIVDLRQNYLTDVGAYSLATSPYGTYDQGGNVREWNESSFNESRGLRGGTWVFGSTELLATNRFGADAGLEADIWGFRVASIPEPSTLPLAIIALLTIPRRPRRSGPFQY